MIARPRNARRHALRNILVSSAVLAAALWLLASCRHEAPDLSTAAYASSAPLSIPPGTRFNVALNGNVSSEEAVAGDSWSGLVSETVWAEGGDVIPAGSTVEGVVSDVLAANAGAQAMLGLAVRSIRINGRDEAVAAQSGPVFAGSARAHGLGAITSRSTVGVSPERTVSAGLESPDVMAEWRGHSITLPDGVVITFRVRPGGAARP